MVSEVVVISDSDEEMAPPPKSVPKVKAKATPVKRKVADTSSEDEKPRKSPATKKVSVAKVGTKSAAKSPDKEKKPAAKKPKKEEGGDGLRADGKPKWVFKPKTGPENPGSKEVPEGAPNCLAGLVFVFTGELDSLSRQDGQNLVKRYGGRVTTAPSKNTTYVVLGRDAGPKKLETIKAYDLDTLTEDQLLELIRQRPAGEEDAKFLEQKKKEEAKVIAVAKTMGLSKDADEHRQQLWTVKYAPTKLTEICGNKGSVEKLSRWLDAWDKSYKAGFKKPGPDIMGVYRAVLISGGPGIGKTTAAHLVAKLAGYTIIELNASDTRSKKLLETAFSATVENTSLMGFYKSEAGANETDANLSCGKKTIIIMDEVDGMSAGDRGGVGALNALIKKTKVPIIAICNDRSNPKMKPLVATCFQMTFKKPMVTDVKSRMMSIAFKEGLKLDAGSLDQLCQGAQSDIRQIVNMLQTYKLSDTAPKSGGKAEKLPMSFDEGKRLAKMSEKNAIQTPWTLYSKLFGPQAFSPVSGLSLNEKLDAYFNDHSIMPLFVQDNYPRAKFSKSTGLNPREKALKDLELLSSAADAISDGDLVDAMIHGGQPQWSLMPIHGMFSCVRPAFYCHGQGGGQPGFPSWFGKNSTQGKLQRLLGDVQIHMRLRISGDRKEIRQNYIPALFGQLVTPLIERGAEAIDDVIQIMDDYLLTKEDWDAIVELGIGEGFENDATLKKIPSAVKSAFTRTYNKREHPVAFHKPTTGRVAKKMIGGAAPDHEDVALLSDDGEDDEEASGDDMGKDKMIKEKKPKAKAAPKKAPAKKATKASP